MNRESVPANTSIGLLEGVREPHAAVIMNSPLFLTRKGKDKKKDDSPGLSLIRPLVVCVCVCEKCERVCVWESE